MEIKFQASLLIIGVNPFVFVPEPVLKQVFQKAGKDKGPVPVKGTVNGKPYRQTLVRFNGSWRLYINTAMLKHSPKQVGKTLDISIAFDPEPRTVEMPVRFSQLLKRDPNAAKVFKQLSPSRQKEILRYLSKLKTEAAFSKNLEKAMAFLSGKGKFAGRERP